MPHLGRVLTAMATPMHPDRTLDLDGARVLASHLVDHGNDGVVVAGTTGESATLTAAETLAVAEAVVDAVGGRARVLVGCGSNDTAATAELARRAGATGADGVMVVTPYYNRPSARGLEVHFRTVAAATDLPVVLYDIPARTAREIPRETIVDLAASVENVVGVKDAVDDFVKTAWVTAHAPEDFTVWSGSDATTLQTLAAGGHGVISVSAHLVGRDVATMVEAFAKDPGAALAIAQRLAPLHAALFVEPSPGPLKAALALVGLPGGPVRPPMVDADEITRTLLRDALAVAGAGGVGGVGGVAQ